MIPTMLTRGSGAATTVYKACKSLNPWLRAHDLLMTLISTRRYELPYHSINNKNTCVCTCFYTCMYVDLKGSSDSALNFHMDEALFLIL